ncbi:AraC family transcriptional regulator [Spirosoma sp. SC4-14]|uniref:helix-turn-helix transcriptional regulator n=1 Tax=Spirosoma sp. SC4-14 TaxID=3128900 RepID=UPI0030D25241
MKIFASNHGHYFDEFHQTYPAEFHGTMGYSETRTPLADEVAQGELVEICFQGVRIHYGQFQISQSDVIRTMEDFPSVEMLFQLQGHRSWQSSVLSELAPKQHNLSYRPSADVCSRFETGHHQYVGIQLTETFFCRFADESSPTLAQLFTHLVQQRATAASVRNLPFTASLQTDLIHLTQIGHRHPLKRLYLETVVIDLLRQQIGQADAQYSHRPTSLKASDIDKVYAVKELLDTDPLAPYSLLQLARTVGLNDYKLKKGYRELFGTTVFGYLNSLRMNYAHQLLRDTDKTIYEVAMQLGYSETHHFSAAFKRTFGYLPSRIARR